jgi:predicted unusual protein kinase regulating ubiquinone biosynthesis (AarF/ABC1/UbiB family)
MRDGIPQLLEAVLRRDREEVLRALSRLGFVARAGVVGDDVAQRLVDYVFARFLADLDLDDWDLSALHFDPRMKMEMLADLHRLDLLMRDLTAAFRVPREWILLLRTLALLAGLCTALDPHLRPATVVRPYLEELALGRDGSPLRLAATLLGDLLTTSLTLPGDVKRFLARAERGETVVQVAGLREGAGLLYALGHQVMGMLAALACGGLAYAAHLQGDVGLATALIWGGGGALAWVAVSIVRARRWTRRLRRGL